MKRARLSGTGTSGTHFQVTSDLQGLIEVVKIAYAEKLFNIELRGQSTRTWPLDREDLLELFGSLMDNACKWARRTVIIGIEDEAVGRVVIEDDGPGCAPERMIELGRRAHRLDESTAGHGLGLSIAGDIVREYGGRIEFDQSPSLAASAYRCLCLQPTADPCPIENDRIRPLDELRLILCLTPHGRLLLALSDEGPRGAGDAEAA